MEPLWKHCHTLPAFGANFQLCHQTNYFYDSLLTNKYSDFKISFYPDMFAKVTTETQFWSCFWLKLGSKGKCFLFRIKYIWHISEEWHRTSADTICRIKYMYLVFCRPRVCVFIFWCVTGTEAVTFHDSLAAPTVHSGSNPRWLRPCRSAEEVPLRRSIRDCVCFPRKPKHQISYQGRWFVEEHHTTPVIDKCGRCFVWLWQTVRVKMGLVSSPFP